MFAMIRRNGLGRCLREWRAPPERQSDALKLPAPAYIVYDTNLKLMKKLLENQDKGFAARDKWFAAKETAGPSEQHKGDGSKRE